ncbi:TPA: hypothetical protein N0F65_001704 [Lagenidium giganteum]|uniref:Amino acid permease/ SLC12A domain-containing protein n=1 Tax=Lagenidium giganteum TaxID=4803 RepID=A0AAV2YKI3_9STRA|nr:TPA: hypothetical protein N0F65_001704 [Lagenidium giganteum]
MGGQYSSWNIDLSAGVYGYLVAYLLVGAAYICLCCCMAEITGALPFAGGAYGLSRCTLGFFPAFLIGCCDAFEYITCVSTAMISLTQLIVSIIRGLEGKEPWIWLVLYTSIVIIHICGAKAFWTGNLVIGSVSFVILLIYCFGCYPFADFKANAMQDDTQLFIDGGSGFLRVLPFAAWFFTGVECLNLASDDCQRPKTTIPKAQVACICTLVVTGLMTFFATVSIPIAGGIPAITNAAAPLDNGFRMMFHVSSSIATFLSIPVTYGVAFGFTWSYTKLIRAMASSRLIPPVLATKNERYGTYHVAVIAGAVAGYVVCLMVYLVPGTSSYTFDVNLMFAFMSYTGQCIGYISLRVKYPSLRKSEFRSPFGIAGAAFSLVIWVLGIISISWCQSEHHVELIIFLVIILCVSLFYHVYSKSRQIFSDGENKVLLVAHVLKFNNRKKYHHERPRLTKKWWKKSEPYRSKTYVTTTGDTTSTGTTSLKA